MGRADPVTLTGLVDRAAAASPDQVLIVADGNRRITAADLARAAGAAAAGFTALGVRRGGAVVSWLPNVPEWYVVHLAAARLGAITVPLNTRFRREELAGILRRLEPDVLVVPRGFLDLDLVRLATEVIDGLAVAPNLVVVDVDGIHRSAPSGAVTLQELLQPADVPDAARPDDLLVAFTTSGTTGTPKLASHDHRAVSRHATNVARHVGLVPDAVLLGALPLCGAFGYAGATAALAGGATIVLRDVFDSDDAAAAFPAHGITHCYGPDVLLRGVLDGADAGGHDLSTWTFAAFADFSSEGGAVAATIERRLGLKARAVYGASELFGLMTVRSADAPFDVRVQAGGVPVGDGISMRIADVDGTVLGPGEAGELHVRGYNVTRGYVGDGDASAAAFTSDGWYRSGDLAVLASDGSLTFLTRMKDTLRLGGFLVDPTEIEEHLSAHPSVARAQVVGVDVPGTGDVAVAFVEPASDQPPDPEVLRGFFRERAAAFKVPTYVLVVEAFPLVSGPNGDKIHRARLRQMAAEHVQKVIR